MNRCTAWSDMTREKIIPSEGEFQCDREASSSRNWLMLHIFFFNADVQMTQTDTVLSSLLWGKPCRHTGRGLVRQLTWDPGK